MVYVWLQAGIHGCMAGKLFHPLLPLCMQADVAFDPVAPASAFANADIARKLLVTLQFLLYVPADTL